MSVDSQVLGTSFIAGGGAGAASILANTGNPLAIGITTGAGLIILLGILTRFAQKRKK